MASGLGDAPIRWLVDDCVKFVEREIRRGNHLRCHYHGSSLLWPRSQRREYGRSRTAIHPLIKLCASLLSDQPPYSSLLTPTLQGLAPAVLTYMLSTELGRFWNGHVDSQEIGLPVRNNRSDPSLRSIRTVGGKFPLITSNNICNKERVLWNN